MSGKSAFRINLEESKRGLFNIVRLNLPTRNGGRRLRPSSRALQEKIVSFTRQGDNEQKDKLSGTRFTYEQGCKEFGCCRATFASALDELRQANLVKKVDRDVDGTEYVYIGPPTAGKFYVIPQYLYTVEIYVDGAYRGITPAQVRVLAYLMTECSSPLNGGNVNYGGGVCRTSYKKLARVLKLSENVIREAIALLMKARLVYRPARNKGKNGKKLSGYEVKSALYIYKKYAKKAKTSEDEQKKRVEYYAELRAQAQRRLNYVENIVEKDSSYMETYKSLRKAELDAVKAEMQGADEKTKLETKARVARLKKERVLILSRLGIAEEELTLQCSCERCKDTGIIDGKWCTCYPGGGGL